MTSSPNTLPPFIPSGPVPHAALMARVVLALGLTMMVFAAWSVRWDVVAEWTSKELLVLPRLTVFALGLIVSLLLQGAAPESEAPTGSAPLNAAPKQRMFLAAGIFALLGAILMAGPTVFDVQDLHPKRISHRAPPIEEPPPDGKPRPPSDEETRVQSLSRRGGGLLMTAPVVGLLRFQLSFFAAVLLGVWIGRGLRTPGHFLMLVVCGAAGDIWLNTFRIPESVPATHPLSLLRLPWPLPIGRLARAPAFTDILLSCALVHGAKRLGFYPLSVFMGAVAGYCAAAFLGLGPWPGWPTLSMLMVGCGVLVGCWPDLKCGYADMGKAFVAGAALLVALLAITLLYQKTHPMPDVPQEWSRHRLLT